MRKNKDKADGGNAAVLDNTPDTGASPAAVDEAAGIPPELPEAPPAEKPAETADADGIDLYDTISFDEIYNLGEAYSEMAEKSRDITEGRRSIEEIEGGGDSEKPEPAEARTEETQPEEAVAEDLPLDYGLEEDDAPQIPFFDRFSFVSRAFGRFYTLNYTLGIQTYRYGKRVLSRVWRLILRPLRFLFALLRVFFISVDRLFFKSVHAAQAEYRLFLREARNSLRRLRQSPHKNPFTVAAELTRYGLKALKRHKGLFRTTANYALPLAALAVFWLTANRFSGYTYALRVQYNGVSIGCIKDESVYIKAREKAKTRLSTGGHTPAEAAGLLENPEYSFSLISLDELTDESALCDRILENSESKITNACGVKINGELLCAVKNETDATSVFDKIIEPYKTGEQNTIVSFVEDIRFTQGLYPDNEETMWDAARLADTLQGKKKEDVYYTVKEGDTVYDIALAHGLSEKQLLAMNKGSGEIIRTGDKLIVSKSVNYVRVKYIKTEKRYEKIAFETVRTNNPSLFRGDTRTVRKGVEGKELITELVTYIDDERVSAKEVSRETVSSPVSAKVEVGTKSTRVKYNEGSYNVTVTSGGFVWPVPSCHSISSYYGNRRSGWHKGIDIAGPGVKGKVIVAAKSGVVEYAGYSRYGLGYNVTINHGGGLKTRYGHCLANSISVSPGQRVSAGQAIARVGATGNVTGPHLHFELLVNGNNVNPLPYLR